MKTPYLTETHELFQNSLRQFVERECPRDLVRQWDREKTFPYEVFRKIAEQGWVGLCLPSEFGGSDADVMYEVLLSEELARYSYELATALNMTEFALRAIARFGTKEQQDKYIPAAVRGDIRFAISVTEPNAGSDAASLQLAAREVEGGFRLNGQKVFATATGLKNTIISVAARTSNTGRRQEGITVFLVPNTTPGLTIRRMDTLARRIAGTNELYFDDVFVPANQVLGQKDKGWEIVGFNFMLERILMAAALTSQAATAYEDALRYARERQQFGKAIGSFQVIKHALVDMRVDVMTSRLLLYQAAWLLNQGADATAEVCAAKLWSSEAFSRIARMGVQILGGYAQLPEYDMERYYREVTVATVGGGTSQIQRELIARTMGLR